METGRFVIKALSDKILVSLTVAVKSTEACMDGTIREVQNRYFDIFRAEGFDASKITIEKE